jgi:hypothetical protein
MLISPTVDPQTQEEVDSLFTSCDRLRQARAYVDHIHFTPPDLHGPLHSAALAHWNMLSVSFGPLKHPEPLPSMPSAEWKYCVTIRSWCQVFVQSSSS